MLTSAFGVAELVPWEVGPSWRFFCIVVFFLACLGSWRLPHVPAELVTWEVDLPL